MQNTFTAMTRIGSFQLASVKTTEMLDCLVPELHQLHEEVEANRRSPLLANPFLGQAMLDRPQCVGFVDETVKWDSVQAGAEWQTMMLGREQGSEEEQWPEQDMHFDAFLADNGSMADWMHVDEMAPVQSMHSPIMTMHMPMEQTVIYNEIVNECESIVQSRHTSPIEGSTSPNSMHDTQDNNRVHFIGSKRERKKAQNRLAATRYRDKQRMAKQSTIGELKVLEMENSRLKTMAGSLSEEIGYLRKLMHEIGMVRR